MNFRLEGRFLHFVAKDGYKLKYLRLSTSAGEYVIKLSKDLRSSLYRTLTPGEWVIVTGYQKLDYKKGTVQFKADQVLVSTPNTAFTPLSVPKPTVSVKPETEDRSKAKACILVCQKSDCCKRGGRAITEALQKELGDRGLTDQVSIKGTGCMKRCKAGPNLVMPDKTRYSRIHPESVSELVEQHFAKDVQPVNSLSGQTVTQST
ncbi:(2Fe-2S) ferredoxin domain-containing protein [Oculatella sp. LEGE 06141]|uniref:(2Fe-2S) ferredoxin domain-containing protein n=1 Tax=Oculatella sp. LEGE 06141 TaxID=1828648 RepID=UPI001D1334F0|nr:(2Fe-2S) ferredoxin domain-containing protein [Oculatella sp. LEGE 06141]